jgi:hypothetical protein
VKPALPSDAELKAMRDKTQRWVTYGWLTFTVAFAVAWFSFPRLAPIEQPMDRLLLALQLAAAPAFVISMILQALMRLNDTLAAENPFLEAESQRFKINQRVMTNTIEQAMIFVPTFVALSIRMRPDQVFLLPMLMGFWCVARLMFWVGYHRANHVRAPGMDWTMGTAFVTLFFFVKSFF